MTMEVGGKAKISGYLEKKGKMKMVSSWKKYWFVLEGRLLLYYRSKDEYEAISPCKGSINLGPLCKIVPALATSCIFQIETRSNTVTLRAESRYEQERWMRAIMSVLNQSPCSSSNRMSHFRYSSDDLSPTQGLSQKRGSTEKVNKTQIQERMKLSGAYCYGGSLQTISNLTNKTTSSPIFPKSEVIKQLLKRTTSVEETKTTNELLFNDLYDFNKKENPCRANERTQHPLTSHSNPNSTENIYEVILPLESENWEENKTNTIYVSGFDYKIIGDVKVNTSKENLYESPLKENEDDKNNILIDNDLYMTNGNIIEVNYDTIDSQKEIENLYEEIDKCKRDLEQYNKSESQEEESKCKVKRKHTFRRFVNSVMKNKTQSAKSNFINKVLRKKGRKRTISEGEVCVKSNGCNDERSLEMLLELQKILEIKKVELEKKISKEMVKKQMRESKEVVVENVTIEKDAEGRRDEKEGGKIHNERIENNWEENLKERVIEYEGKEKDIRKEVERKHEVDGKKEVEEKKEDLPENLIKLEESEEPKPSLPLKQKNLSKENIKDDQHTIDEILRNLNKDEPPLKVKQLINKFNEKINNNEEVTLRKKTSNLHLRENSDDLNTLLEELSKVTNAPVMTPGVTSSLKTDALTNEEWLRLMPIRYRRKSEPDYDIPRPHGSLLLLHRKSNREELNGSIVNFEEKLNPSTFSSFMTPDSLEVENFEEPELLRQHSNTCVSNNNVKRNGNVRESEEIIYARPRSFITNKTTSKENQKFSPYETNKYFEHENEIYNMPQYFRKDGKDEGGIKSLDVFVDSLETFGETSTIF